MIPDYKSEKYLRSISPKEFSEIDYLRHVADDYDFTPAELRTALYGPPDKNKAVATKGRYLATRYRPLLWTLIYDRPAITLKDGPLAGKVTMNTLSLEFFSNLLSWCQPNDEPEQGRHLLSAPRESGKSMCLAHIAPAYLLATSGRPEFVYIVTASQAKAKERMSGIRQTLNNPLLQLDYPGVEPAKRGSFKESDTIARLKLASKSVLATNTIGASDHAGALEGTTRVTLTILDDISPSGGSFHPLEEHKRLSTVREVLYELGKYQRIWWVGTTTAFNSLVHQALQAKNNDDWAIRDKWQIHRNPPIIESVNKDGSIQQESYWPAAYPIEYLQELRKRDFRLFSLNWLNDPQSASDGEWWSEDLFNYEELPSRSLRVITIDPGISKTGDPCGIGVVSFSHSAKKACIDEVFELKAKSTDIKAAIFNLISRFPDVRNLIWESVQGGSEYAYSILGQDFESTTGIKLRFITPKGDKVFRSELLLGRYKQGQVLHAKQFPNYEKELMSMPFYLRSPNQTDAIGQAIEWIAHAQPAPVNTLAVTNRRHIR